MASQGVWKAINIQYSIFNIQFTRVLWKLYSNTQPLSNVGNIPGSVMAHIYTQQVDSLSFFVSPCIPVEPAVLLDALLQLVKSLFVNTSSMFYWAKPKPVSHLIESLAVERDTTGGLTLGVISAQVSLNEHQWQRGE